MSDSCCPYLEAIGKTPSTPRPYPSHRHRCAAGEQSQVVAPRTQAHFCLIAQHQNCPFFSAGARERSQPEAPAKPTQWPTLGTTLIATVLLVTVATILFFWARTETEVIAAPAKAIQPTATAPQAALSPTNTPVPPNTPTTTPTSTATPSPTPARPPAMHPPDRIQIPIIDLDAPIVEVGQQILKEDGQSIATWKVADYAAGFHKGSAYPGHHGNTVLSGHHNIKGEVFRYLVDVSIGAEVLLYVGEQAYPYVISQKMILPEKNVSLEERQENARWIEPFPDERLTVVTCWPYEDNTHRLIVIAHPRPLP